MGIGEVGPRLVAVDLVADQDEAPEQRPPDDPADGALPGARVLEAGEESAEDREDRGDQVGGLRDPEQEPAKGSEEDGTG